MSTLSKLLHSKQLNTPRRNLTFREDLQNAIKDTIIKYKEIISRNDTGVCAECFNELKQEQVIDEIEHNQ